MGLDFYALSFRRKDRLLALSFPSVRNVSQQLPLDGFTYTCILSTFKKIYLDYEKKSWLKSGKNI